MTAPIRSMPETLMIADHGQVIAVVRTLQDAVDVFRLMKERLGLTNEFIDDVGGLTKGHADKILGPSEERRLGYDTFALLTALTAIEFRVHIDMDAIKRMESIWEKRERPLYPNAKVKRVSKKLVERAKPYVLREFGAMGGKARATLLTPKQRCKIARKAARKSPRLKGLSPQRRIEIARKAGLASAAKRKAAILSIADESTDCISGSLPAAS